MKKIICFTFFIFITLNSIAQVFMSKEQFRGLNENEKNLYLKIKRNDSLKTARVNNYLSIMGKDKKILKGDNKVYVLTDVINDKPIYTTTDNADAAEATGTNHLQVGGSLGLDLDGSGITVAVWDGGPIQLSHTEFQDASGSNSRGLNLEALNTDGDPVQDNHATHVSGTIAARGVVPSAKGMATAVNLRNYNFNNDTPEMMGALSNPASPIYLSNHSYGVPVSRNGVTQDAWYMGSYGPGAREVDEILRMYPKYLMVASAGNSGNSVYAGGLFNNFDKLTTDKVAKNNLVVANANPSIGPFSGDLNLVINPGSSQGPTDDLRVKPDIAADGTNLFSPTTGDGYSTFTGTSMAAPNTTGTLVLLQQYYEQLYGEYMNSSTLKGLVCHTTIDDDNVVGPDPTFGWGFLNAKFAAETITASNNNTSVLSELNLDNGQTFTYTFSAQAGDKLRATICWTDLPGVAVANGTLNSPDPRLINDLDIRITKDGNTYFPWKLDYSSSSGFSNSKADNIVDNVERIDLEAPSSGTYTLTVTHKGTLLGDSGPFAGDQDFSLIVTGDNLVLSTDENNLSSSLSLFPNPNNGEFTVSFNSKEAKNVKIDIYDVSGRLVYRNTYNNSSSQFKQKLSLSDLTAGVYIANISEGNRTTSKKIIIE